ncbi:MAG TPA: hypothetical protein VKQ36_15010 [Ktedonobacterales bacterium]|nr:hypothetical protein [Ktedonobacterales bacterium]
MEASVDADVHAPVHAPVHARGQTRAGHSSARAPQNTQGKQAKQSAHIPSVEIEDGHMVMRVGGVIQSVKVDERYIPDVWDAMLPRRRPASALILGLGGGTIATLLTQRWGAFPTVGVERDPAVVALARHAFGLDALPHLRIVTDDAFNFVRRATHSLHLAQHAHHGHQRITPKCDAQDKNTPQNLVREDDSDVYSLCEAYDAICVDLYTAGKMAHGVLSGAFLRELAMLLAPGGEIILNLWRSAYLEDHLRRIRKALIISELMMVDDNVVVHCVAQGSEIAQ